MTQAFPGGVASSSLLETCSDFLDTSVPACGLAGSLPRVVPQPPFWSVLNFTGDFRLGIRGTFSLTSSRPHLLGVHPLGTFLLGILLLVLTPGPITCAGVSRTLPFLPAPEIGNAQPLSSRQPGEHVRFGSRDACVGGNGGGGKGWFCSLNSGLRVLLMRGSAERTRRRVFSAPASRPRLS